MGARRYGISLWVLNSIAREWDVELNTRTVISYQQATVCYFVYHIYILNSLLLTKKSTWLMNENERIDNSRLKIVKCVGGKAQDEKLRWNTTKTNNAGREIAPNTGSNATTFFTLATKSWKLVAKLATRVFHHNLTERYGEFKIFSTINLRQTSSLSLFPKRRRCVSIDILDLSELERWISSILVSTL